MFFIYKDNKRLKSRHKALRMKILCVFVLKYKKALLLSDSVL